MSRPSGTATPSSLCSPLLMSERILPCSCWGTAGLGRSTTSDASTSSASGKVTLAGASPRDCVQALEGYFAPGLLADAELLRVPVKTVERGVNLGQLAGHPGGNGRLELRLHRVSSPIGLMEGKGAQVTGAVLVRLPGMLVDR